jgi:hypothetical protein
MGVRVKRPLPPVEFLRECLDYEPKTGVLIWRERPREHFPDVRAWHSWTVRYAGKKAGTTNNNGYHNLNFNGMTYLASRVITKWMTGDDPPRTVDHRDHDRLNDRWENLRPATQLEQTWNRRVLRKSTSGFRGVFPNGSGWRAAINNRGLGQYDTPEEAAAAYEIEARKIHGAFYCEPEYAAALISTTPKRRVRRMGLSGFRNVHWQPNAWVAEISLNGHKTYLGRFETPEEAHEACLVARMA